MKKSRLNILIGAAGLLLIFNIVKWTGVWKEGSGDTTEVSATRRLQVDFQKPADAQNAKPARNLFSGGPAGEYFSQGGNETGYVPGKKANPTPAPTAVSAKKWPDFKISGTALNDGKKSAFFSGAAYNGAVNEGDDINEGYKLVAINERDVDITDKTTNETRKFPMEGK
jgi:hypothetical protein